MLNIENTSDEQVQEAIDFKEFTDMMEQWANERSECEFTGESSN